MKVPIDTTGWSQKKINLIQAMAVKLLFDNAVAYSGLRVSDGIITIDDPSGSVSFLTSEAIAAAYDAWKTANDAANAVAEAEEAARQTELTSNTLSNITLAQIDTAINAISNLAEAKVFLRKLARYLKARGI